MVSNAAGGAAPYLAAMQQAGAGAVQPSGGAASVAPQQAAGNQVASVTGAPLVGTQTSQPGTSTGNTMLPFNWTPNAWTDPVSAFNQALAQIAAANPVAAIQAATPMPTSHKQGGAR